MKPAADPESWRQKYFDSLARLEQEQARYRATETVIKRLAGRLCTAALGQSPRLDEQIRRLQAALRRESNHDELEQITPALTDAIQALDLPAIAAVTVPAPAAPAGAPIGTPAVAAPAALIGDERIRAVLSALLAELRRDAELASSVDALDARLTAQLSAEEFPDILASLTGMVTLRIGNIERARQELEVLLGHMVGRLDEIGQFVADQNRSHSESQANSETLNVQLAGEMKAMGDSVDASSDLQQIRTQVRNRLDSIDQHLQQFRQREAALASEVLARSEQMRSRITELEAEAGRLHNQLRDEQRLSSVDALTKVANRLAYEKRMEDELHRWERFRQPTCIAVWDVDRFKHINDTYGHRAGDRVLRAVAECLSSQIRGTDFIARYGGEEFVMILPGTTLEDAVRLADGIRESVTKIGFHFRGAPVSITISSGITALRCGDSSDGAFDRADKALYRAKEQGRDRCVGA